MKSGLKHITEGLKQGKVLIEHLLYLIKYNVSDFFNSYSIQALHTLL